MTAIQGPATAPDRKATWIACALALLAVVAAHGGIDGAQLLTFDDWIYVSGNPQVQGGLTTDGIRWAFRMDHRGTYFHPLTWISLMADRQLLGPGPFGFHAVNVALQAAAAVLLLLALARATGRLGASLAAVLLFAVHPLTVESVMWVAERKTVLSGALGFAAVLAYVHYARTPSRLRMALVAILFGLSLLAKPGVVLLPALLLVLDFWPLGRLRLPGLGSEAPGRVAPWRLVVEKLPLAALTLTSLAVSVYSVRYTLHEGSAAAPLGRRVANALATLPDYLGAALWPHDLAPFHPFPAEVPAARVVAGVALLVVCSAVAVATAARRPWILAGWSWFLLALAPYLGLLQAGLWPAWADRFMYVPLVGLAMALVFEVADRAERHGALRLPAIAAVAAISALGAGTRAQGAHWRTSEALYRRAIAVEPGSANMQYNLGTELAVSGRLAEARPYLEAAIRIANGDYPRAQAQLGSLAHAQGRVAEAEALFLQALQREPNQPEALYNLANLLRRQGRFQEARPFYVRFLAATAAGELAAQRAIAQAAVALPP